MNEMGATVTIRESAEAGNTGPVENQCQRTLESQHMVAVSPLSPTGARHVLLSIAALLLVCFGGVKLAAVILELVAAESFDAGRFSSPSVLIGFSESCAGVILVFHRHRGYANVLLLLVGVAFTAYRILDAFALFEQPCPCLGIAGGLFGYASLETEKSLLNAFALWFLLAGAWCVLTWDVSKP